MSKMTYDSLLDVANEVFYNVTAFGDGATGPIISNQTKSVFIVILVKSFSYQSFRQRYLLSKIGWVALG